MEWNISAFPIKPGKERFLICKIQTWPLCPMSLCPWELIPLVWNVNNKSNNNKQNNINNNNENINNLSICPNSSLRPLSSSPGSLSSLCWNKISTKMNFQEVSYWPNTTTWSFTSVRTLAASKSVSTGRPLRCLQSVMVESVRNIFITFHAAKSSAPTRRCLRRKLERLPEGFRFSLSEG